MNYIKKPFLPEELVDRVSKAILNEWQKPKENDKPKSNVETTDKNEKDDQPKIRFDDESFDDEYHSDFRHRFGDFF